MSGLPKIFNCKKIAKVGNPGFIDDDTEATFYAARIKCNSIPQRNKALNIIRHLVVYKRYE